MATTETYDCIRQGSELQHRTVTVLRAKVFQRTSCIESKSENEDQLTRHALTSVDIRICAVHRVKKMRYALYDRQALLTTQYLYDPKLEEYM